LILENHAAVIPQTARQAILGPEEKAKSKYNSRKQNDSFILCSSISNKIKLYNYEP